MPAERIMLDDLMREEGPESPMAQLSRAAADGAIFVYPTETVYGIGGIVEERVRARIIEAKKRPADKSMIIIAASLDSLAYLKLRFNAASEALARAFWPGNLTLIVHSDMMGHAAAVRVSAHPFLLRMAMHCSRPLYSTSANVSDREYKNDPDFIYETFCRSVDFMVDAGQLPRSVPSTVVDAADNGNVRIVREGAIEEHSIRAIFIHKRGHT